MAKVPSFAKAFVGRWRIVETSGTATSSILSRRHISPSRANPMAKSPWGSQGLPGRCATGPATDRPAPSSHWEGQDENDPSCGRGWAMIGTAGRLVGHFYIHNGDDSAFVCERG
jgi:hypothetical protein